MRNEQQHAIQLEHLAEYYKGNPVVNHRHVISSIHEENPDMIFPQMSKLMKLKPAHQMDEERGFERQQAALSASSSHTSPEEVLSLCPTALNEFIAKENEIAKENGVGQFNKSQASINIRRFYGYYDNSTPEGGLCHPKMGMAAEEVPLTTPRESMFRDFKNGAFTGKIEIKSSDWDAYVLNHEVGHRRAYKLGMRSSENLPEAGNSAGVEKLRSKQQQVHFSEGGQDIYGSYLEESFCDTFAVLQHLKNGGDPAFVQTLSDRRENDVVNNEFAYRYHTHTSLKAVAKNSETLQQRLAHANNEEVVEMAADIVGEHSYNREEYYQHAFAALGQNFKQTCGPDFGSIGWQQSFVERRTPVANDLWNDYSAGRSQGHSPGKSKGFLSGLLNKHKGDETPDQFMAKAVSKYAKKDEKKRLKAEKRLTDVPEATPEELKAEVLGQIKYVMSKHPEKTPELLLREREAFLKQKYRERHIDIPQYVRHEHDGIREHLAGQRAESVARGMENKKNISGATMRDEQPTEPDKHYGDQPYELER